jgi:uncharacterized membrane protein
MTKNIDQIIKSAIVNLVALTAVGGVIATSQALAAEKTEKCYGIVKAGMNDCETTNTSCAGSATKDNQSDAYVFVPKGLCNKIVGGSLTSKKP